MTLSGKRALMPKAYLKAGRAPGATRGAGRASVTGATPADASGLFDYADAALRDLVADVLQQAKALGATAASAEVSESAGLSVTVRKRKVETIEQTRDKGLGISVHVGHRRGHASTSDFSPQALQRTVRAAYDIARITGEDPFAGLPDENRLATAGLDAAGLDLFQPWYLPVDSAIDLATEVESAALDTSSAIGNSDGASVSIEHGHFVTANSLGFVGGYPYSRHTIGCAPIARRGRQMQVDHWYSSNRSAAALADPRAVGRYAAERALARLGARKLGTRKAPVLFEAPLAVGLLGSFVQAVSGSSLYRRSSFLLDSLGKPVFPDHVSIHEDPFIPGGMGSSPFDDEGVSTAARDVVAAGVLQGYFLSSYSARKLGMQTTGNAGGSHNLTLTSSRTGARDSFAQMLKKLDTGLLVTSVMGQGVNTVTGDYSRGASGFWVERGQIQYPVEEITIAGNLAEMYRSIVAVGADTINRGTKTCGSLLIEQMSIAG